MSGIQVSAQKWVGGGRVGGWGGDRQDPFIATESPI